MGHYEIIILWYILYIWKYPKENNRKDPLCHSGYSNKLGPNTSLLNKDIITLIAREPFRWFLLPSTNFVGSKRWRTNQANECLIKYIVCLHPLHCSRTVSSAPNREIVGKFKVSVTSNRKLLTWRNRRSQPSFCSFFQWN